MADQFRRRSRKAIPVSSERPNDDVEVASNTVPEIKPKKSVCGQLDASSPPPPRKLDLATLPDIRREMARLYRDMRSGEMSTNDGSRCAFVLGQIGRLLVEEHEMSLETTSAKSYDDFLDEVLAARPKNKSDTPA
jgi:hypothetical protein